MITLRVEGLKGFDMGTRIIEEHQRFSNRLYEIGERFARYTVGTAQKKYLSGPRPEKLNVVKGRLRASIAHRIKGAGKNLEITVGSNVKYAAIHELGGTVRTPVTDRMRAWSWWKFKKTGDDFFKRLALTKKSAITRKIEPRPFLQPAVEDSLPGFAKELGDYLEKEAIPGVE